MKNYSIYIVPLLIVGIGFLVLDRSIDMQWHDTYFILSQGHLLLFVCVLLQMDLIMMSLRGTRVLDDRWKKFFFILYTILSLLIALVLGLMDHQELLYEPFIIPWKAYTLGIFLLLFLGAISVRWTLRLLTWIRTVWP